jgi:hypothetical protein
MNTALAWAFLLRQGVVSSQSTEGGQTVLNFKHFYLSVIIALLFVSSAATQTTEFTYQGKLNDGANPANAGYDMQFRLFDDPGAGQGNQIGSTITKLALPVTSGIFATPLDFGSAVFDAGANRYLEIRIRPAGSSGGYTSLAPRSKVTASPYAVKSLKAETAVNAGQLGGVNASQYVQTNDLRLTDARNPLAGSSNYIQNGTALQAASNFTISGTGKANNFDAANFSINGVQAIRTATVSSIYLGNFAGSSNTVGDNNTHVGGFSGMSATSGSSNTFIGTAAGQINTTGTGNTFVGVGSGGQSATGNFNTAIGSLSNLGSNVSFATVIGSGAQLFSNDRIQIGKAAGTYDGVPRPADTVSMSGGLEISGTLYLGATGAAGGNPVCRNASSFISLCSSSLRYKTAVQPYNGGLSIAKRLQPIAFEWKEGGLHDVGFGAEDVAKVEPLLVFNNSEGQIEGVNYGHMTTVLVNSIKEQQAQIEALQNLVKAQQTQSNLQQVQINKQRRQIRSLLRKRSN